MGFNQKRGRPKSSRQMNDAGTPELAMKRAYRFTTEPIDLCLERGLLSQAQHWCAIHLRWLYTIRYGTPDVHAIDPTHLGGVEIRTNDPDWQASREQELAEALNHLQAIRAHSILLRLCVHNELLSFLKTGTVCAEEYELYKLREGLDLLRTLWMRSKQNSPSPRHSPTKEDA